MGEISDEDDSDFAPVDVDIRAMDDQGAEDLFFSSSSFVQSRDIGADTSFGWDNTPIVSPLTVNVMQSTPSPRSKVAPVASKLEKKYRPRARAGRGCGENVSTSTPAPMSVTFRLEWPWRKPRRIGSVAFSNTKTDESLSADLRVQ